MKKFLKYLLLTILPVSCMKNNVSPSLSGEYSGTAEQHTGPYISLFNIQLTFTADSFKGKSENNLPIICSGNFKITRDSINFQNPCVLPAFLDESFVMGGKYKVVIFGDSLIFSHRFFNTQETYNLKKQ
jgi:hypothetical protein